MKIARLSLTEGPRFAVVDDAGNYHVISGDPIYSKIEQTGQVIPAADANLVAPMLPRSKVIGIGGNFNEDRTMPAAGESPRDGQTFLKPNTSVVGPNVPITIPAWSTQGLTVAGGIAIVISRLCKDVAVERVPEVIFGYTAAIDATDEGSLREGWLVEAKSFDTSLTIGPVIETELDLADVRIETAVNGEVVASGSTSEWVRDAMTVVSHLSRISTLLPGDIVLTGAPGAPAHVEPGDEVTVTVDGIGTLRNPVA